jgi:hypothetical protein
MVKPQDNVALPFDNLRDMGIHAHTEPLLRSKRLSVWGKRTDIYCEACTDRRQKPHADRCELGETRSVQ